MSSELDSLVTFLDPPANNEIVAEWLAKYVSEERPYLLAHADDGVIWGKWLKGKGLHTSRDVSAEISPHLRGATLQQAVVFGPKSEVRLFRDEIRNWQACQIVDGTADRLVETQMLTGDLVVRNFNSDFTHLRDRIQQGLDQIVPISITQAQLDGDLTRGVPPMRARLIVHHFVEYDGRTGEARIGLSRLAGIELARIDQ